MTTGKRRKTTKPAKTMADYAMPLDRLDRWLRERARSTVLPHPAATSLSMLDGFVTAIVAGPISINPPDWVCPLLGVELDAFNHDNEEFSAIAAAGTRHNTISDTLSTNPDRFEPMFNRHNGEVDAKPWCNGFYVAMKLRWFAWSRLLNPNVTEYELLAPILSYCVDEAGRPLLYPERSGLMHSRGWREIAPAVEAMRQYWMPSRFSRAHAQGS